ncbi:hypothetical protein F9C07_2647 [Aspergillus flavus]|uniref:Uncharacterized protein n=1 Tax=Aspergillus flavus (strain ATCC 200026 / FGSC A1120 / IAM 13836 / NRRL 3357 / JCM 12722 / SRRC 167) TaxID=332952 RepID=A0A7U2MES3_ASPFN|nr:hypothetical protein F9C07_2647 [Aspergillus flavus]
MDQRRRYLATAPKWKMPRDQSTHDASQRFEIMDLCVLQKSAAQSASVHYPSH